MVDLKHRDAAITGMARFEHSSWWSWLPLPRRRDQNPSQLGGVVDGGSDDSGGRLESKGVEILAPECCD
ncbi:hypothetical protein F0562_021213 [Nyssa sinensis]|uniref:Uncharacterized protein n=1 Tax=Nyssa sinensis TaxID=561372 RepID=A0A5J5BNL7_9ASTE|nr:hypothetical protein F0562_021213 [Nyssa sinensis]